MPRHIPQFLGLGRLLLDAGFQDLQQRAFAIDSSAYHSWHYHILKTLDLTMTLLKPYLLTAGMMEAQCLDDLQRQMLLEMLQEDYTCLTFGLTVWAHAPLAAPPVRSEEATPAVPEPA